MLVGCLGKNKGYPNRYLISGFVRVEKFLENII